MAGSFLPLVSAVQTITPEDEAIAQNTADSVRGAWDKDGKTKLSQHKTRINQFRKQFKSIKQYFATSVKCAYEPRERGTRQLSSPVLTV